MRFCSCPTLETVVYSPRSVGDRVGVGRSRSLSFTSEPNVSLRFEGLGPLTWFRNPDQSLTDRLFLIPFQDWGIGSGQSMFYPLNPDKNTDSCDYFSYSLGPCTGTYIRPSNRYPESMLLMRCGEIYRLLDSGYVGLSGRDKTRRRNVCKGQPGWPFWLTNFDERGESWRKRPKVEKNLSRKLPPTRDKTTWDRSPQWTIVRQTKAKGRRTIIHFQNRFPQKEGDNTESSSYAPCSSRSGFLVSLPTPGSTGVGVLSGTRSCGLTHRGFKDWVCFIHSINYLYQSGGIDTKV